MGIKELFIEIGREEGREEVRQERRQIAKEAKKLFVRNLLAGGFYTSSKIAALAGVSEYYVRKIKRTMKPNSVIS